ncbi:MAG TPA: hypothetical protein PKL31_11810 [Fulvivirga sp.]|nr:hypothetical protein [Fulvivirga sp.]
MSKKFLNAAVLFFLALTCICCSTCEECQNDLTTKYIFVDTLRNEILKDASLVNVVDLTGVTYPTERVVIEEDTLYSTDLADLFNSDRADTVLITYNNQLIDTVAVSFSFSSDSRCCANTQKVGKLTFFNRQTAKRIKPLFSVYNIIID